MHPNLKDALQEWRSQTLCHREEDFVFPSERLRGAKPLDLASILKRKIQPAFKRIGITGVTKRSAQDKLVDAILPTGILPKTDLIQ
jgi:hypothetical protein